MAAQQARASRDMIRRVVTRLVPVSYLPLLTEVLFWFQYAQAFENDRPMIWKTAKDLGRELGCCDRTASRQMKYLRERGFWDIVYRPRPGSIGKVTWLNGTVRAVELLECAVALNLERIEQGKGKRTSGGAKLSASADTPCNTSMSHKLTASQNDSKKNNQDEKKGSFFLSKEAWKKGMNEPPSKFQEKVPGEKGEKSGVKAPGYKKATLAEIALGTMVQEVWLARDRPGWDWSSGYTWDHIRELVSKFAKAGLLDPTVQREFLGRVIDSWSWARFSMEDRYSNHASNLHAPSPMALAHEFERLLQGVNAEYASKPQSTGKSNFDDLPSNLNEDF